MIRFNKLSSEAPFLLFKEKYNQALLKNQKNIEAISIASYSLFNNEIDSRFVNLKTIDKKSFIFFSNYNSTKSKQFKSNNKIAALFFWDSINTQIRIKAKIYKLDESLSDLYFKNRKKEKNALAISSMQSEPIESFDLVKKNFLNTLQNTDLQKRPKYWGGYYFIPFEFEFWIGHEYRLNQRTQYKLIDNDWKKTLLQP